MHDSQSPRPVLPLEPVVPEDEAELVEVPLEAEELAEPLELEAADEKLPAVEAPVVPALPLEVVAAAVVVEVAVLEALLVEDDWLVPLY